MAIIIAGYIDLAPDEAEAVIAGARELIEASLAEPGCRAYSWALDPLHPGRVQVFEEWDDEASLAGHFADESYRAMSERLRSGSGILAFSVAKYRTDLTGPVYDDAGTPRADFFTA